MTPSVNRQSEIDNRKFYYNFPMPDTYPTLLVTGGCGFMGSHVIRMAMRQLPGLKKLVNLDALTYAANPDNLADVAGDPRYQFVHGDICDRDLIQHVMAGVDAVIHLAAETHVDRSIADNRPFVTTNVLGTQTLIDAAISAKVRRFVHISTDEVYGSLSLDPAEKPFRETDPLRPRNPYAASKAAADHLVLAAYHTHQLPGVITRSCNNFGPGQYPEKIIPLFVHRLKAGRKVPLYGDGLHVRDWLHVVDHAEAVLAVLERGRTGEVYNIGANNPHSNLELTRTLLRLTGRDESLIEHVTDRPGHDRRYELDVSKIAEELGWRASRSNWPGALKDVV